MTNKNQPALSQTLQLLEQLKNAFLSELPEQCQQLSTLMLSLAQQPEDHDIYEELYRKVHSLKGSAGTHGIDIISQICHHFEDLLGTLDSESTQLDSCFTDNCLRYVDLIQEATKSAQTSPADYTAIEHELAHIRQNLSKDNLRGLIVEPSLMMTQMYQGALSSLPVQLSLLDNGLTALEHLIHKKFDFLILGKELKQLNGAALISALRASDSINSTIATIMVTTNNRKNVPGHQRPDYLIKRDTKMANNLLKAVESIINTPRRSLPHHAHSLTHKY